MTPGADLPPPEELPSTKTYTLSLKDGQDPMTIDAASCEIEGLDYVFYDSQHDVVATVPTDDVESVDVS